MDTLKIIADNPKLLEALTELFDKHIEDHGKVDDSLSDERLGQIYRARLVTKQVVADAMRTILMYRTKDETKKAVNPAR